MPLRGYGITPGGTLPAEGHHGETPVRGISRTDTAAPGEPFVCPPRAHPCPVTEKGESGIEKLPMKHGGYGKFLERQALGCCSMQRVVSSLDESKDRDDSDEDKDEDDGNRRTKTKKSNHFQKNSERCAVELKTKHWKRGGGHQAKHSEECRNLLSEIILRREEGKEGKEEGTREYLGSLLQQVSGLDAQDDRG